MNEIDAWLLGNNQSGSLQLTEPKIRLSSNLSYDMMFFRETTLSPKNHYDNHDISLFGLSAECSDKFLEMDIESHRGSTALKHLFECCDTGPEKGGHRHE